VHSVTAVPLFLGGLPVVAYTLLDEREATGGAPAFMRGAPFVPAALAICRCPEGGFYLFGCDVEWNAVTDTWHETVEDAQYQAESDHGGATLRLSWQLS
jgi:hypothetical protein